MLSGLCKLGRNPVAGAYDPMRVVLPGAAGAP